MSSPLQLDVKYCVLLVFLGHMLCLVLHTVGRNIAAETMRFVDDESSEHLL